MQINARSPLSMTQQTAGIQPKATDTSQVKSDIQETALPQLQHNAGRMEENVRCSHEKFRSHGAQSGQHHLTETRFKNTLYILKEIGRDDELDNKDTLCFTSYIKNEPAGLLALSNDADEGHAHLIYMVSLPESKGVGSQLAEKAANQSERWGHDGKVMLCINGDASRQSYLKMGFTNVNEYGEADGDDSDYMLLDPAQSEKWEKASGTWQMIR